MYAQSAEMIRGFDESLTNKANKVQMIQEFQEMEERYDFKIKKFNDYHDKIDAEVKVIERNQSLVNESL